MVNLILKSFKFMIVIMRFACDTLMSQVEGSSGHRASRVGLFTRMFFKEKLAGWQAHIIDAWINYFYTKKDK